LNALFYHYDVDLIIETSDINDEKCVNYYQRAIETTEAPLRIVIPVDGERNVRDECNNEQMFKYKVDSKTQPNYGLIEVINSTFLNWSFKISIRNTKEKIIDQISILKDHNNAHDRVLNWKNQLLNNDKVCSSKKTSNNNFLILVVISSGILFIIGCVWFKKYWKQRTNPIKYSTNYHNLMEELN
jgi:hypothetical protein